MKRLLLVMTLIALVVISVAQNKSGTVVTGAVTNTGLSTHNGGTVSTGYNFASATVVGSILLLMIHLEQG